MLTTCTSVKIKFIALFTCLTCACPVLAQILDEPIVQLRGHRLLWINLKAVDPALDENSTFRQIVSDEFHTRFMRECPLNLLQNYWCHPEPREALELRQALAALGLPANLSKKEIRLLEKNPNHILFRSLAQIDFATRLHAGQTFLKRANSNGIYFVIDFIKAYSTERQRLPARQFRRYGSLSRVTMDSAAEIIFDEDRKCESLMGNYPAAPPPDEPAFYERIIKGRAAEKT